MAGREPRPLDTVNLLPIGMRIGAPASLSMPRASDLTFSMHINDILMFAVAVSLGFFLGKFRTHWLQNQSEAVVSRTLSAAFPPPQYHLMNNVTIPTNWGSTQIDHVLVSRFGVFVLEAKHYKGWIFANTDSPTWTQVLFEHRFKFQNPLRQNHGHVRAVHKLLDFLPPELVHSVVVFTGDADFKVGKPGNVLTLEELVPYLRGFSDEVISENRLQFCVGRLECNRFALTRQTDIAHRERLARRFGGRS